MRPRRPRRRAIDPEARGERLHARGRGRTTTSLKRRGRSRPRRAPRQKISVPAELLASPVYANVRKAYARARRMRSAGCRRSRSSSASSAERGDLRGPAAAARSTLAKEGLQITRFKGLGEMNEDELWETTMDPARRMLIRVDVEDASAADLWFSG